MVGQKKHREQYDIELPQSIIDSFARFLVPEIRKLYTSEEGQKELEEWKKKYPDISEALKKGKEVVDIQVENALLKRALGYSYKETKTEETADGDKVTVTVKEVVPDTTAQIFWLKNRRPDKWRDKQDIEHSGQIGGVMIIDDIPKPDTS